MTAHVQHDPAEIADAVASIMEHESLEDEDL